MVHALREAHRALRPGGLLIDLRPAAVHRRIGLGTARRWQALVAMQEDLSDDRAATRAVSQVVQAGVFRRRSRTVFSLDRVMDTLNDFDAWLGDFSDTGGAAARRRLSDRVRFGLQASPKGKSIVVRAPLVLAVLCKQPAVGREVGPIMESRAEPQVAPATGPRQRR